MPKKIRFESAKYHSLLALERLTKNDKLTSTAWGNFISNLEFQYVNGVMEVYYPGCDGRPYSVLLKRFGLYSRGDRSPKKWGDSDASFANNAALADEIAEGLVAAFRRNESRVQK